jgi:heat shock protein HtpX
MISSAGRFTNQLKTWLLLAALGGLLVLVGGLIGGRSGLTVALLMAVVLNFGVYWFSDTIALKMNRARPLEPGQLPEVERIVRDLSTRAGIPMPRLYFIDRPEPNAFATGRSPSHAAVAVTTGLLELVDERQLRGVLAHELSHVVNRDTLVGAVAATIGATVSYVAQMAQWSMIFGGRDDNENANPIVMLAVVILAPIAALIIQLAVSRAREYGADVSGARLTGDPEGLAQALERLESVNVGMRERLAGMFRRREQQPVPAATAHLYIVNPLSGGSVATLFSTHPPIQERVRRLRTLRW